MEAAACSRTAGACQPTLKEKFNGSCKHSLTNHVVVHLGEEPLPRFGNDWLYGDLHYHSQGTDNEGEVGCSTSVPPASDTSRGSRPH